MISDIIREGDRHIVERSGNGYAMFFERNGERIAPLCNSCGHPVDFADVQRGFTIDSFAVSMTKVEKAPFDHDPEIYSGRWETWVQHRDCFREPPETRVNVLRAWMLWG